MLMRTLAQVPVNPNDVIDPGSPTSRFYWPVVAGCIVLGLLAVATFLYLIRRGNTVRWCAFILAIFVAGVLLWWFALPYGVTLAIVTYLAVVGVGLVIDRSAPDAPFATRAGGFPLDRSPE